MTIIQPNKNNHKTSFLISVLLITSISAALWGIFLYNQLVNLRHEVKKQETNLRRAEVTNAELKNNLYNIIDTKNLEPLIKSQSLILDKNPEYIKIVRLQIAGLQD
jgi:cell division protein FtsB